MASATLKMISDKLKNISPTTEAMLMNLHEQHAIVYDKELITTESARKMNDAETHQIITTLPNGEFKNLTPTP